MTAEIPEFINAEGNVKSAFVPTDGILSLAAGLAVYTLETQTKLATCDYALNSTDPPCEIFKEAAYPLLGIAAMLDSVVAYVIVRAASWDLQTAMRWLTGSLNGASQTKMVPLLILLLPSIAERRTRALPRLQLGFTDPWAVAIGAAAEPISRTFDPRFSAILKR